MWPRSCSSSAAEDPVPLYHTEKCPQTGGLMPPKYFRASHGWRDRRLVETRMKNQSMTWDKAGRDHLLDGPETLRAEVWLLISGLRLGDLNLHKMVLWWCLQGQFWQRKPAVPVAISAYWSWLSNHRPSDFTWVLYPETWSRKISWFSQDYNVSGRI